MNTGGPTYGGTAARMVEPDVTRRVSRERYSVGGVWVSRLLMTA